jgi:hypothetical protein
MLSNPVQARLSVVERQDSSRCSNQGSNSQATLLLVQALSKPDQANKTRATKQPANIHVAALQTA